MYFRAGVFSLVLLLLSRLLGLVRESAQAAAFGSTGLGDAVIVMFTLPDLLVGILISGALGYVLLPAWAEQTSAQQSASQKTVGRWLLLAGVGLAALIWLLRDSLTALLAPGLQGEMRALGAASLGWSAAVLPLAMLAALWVTRLQHERDFVGMYAANLVVNGVLVLALFGLIFLTHSHAPSAANSMLLLGGCLLLAMLARLLWLQRRLPRSAAAHPSTEVAALPGARIWLWAGLSSGLLLLLPLAARSLASQSGEGALTTFNYAWKLVELPLVLAVQLVASLAFPAITRAANGSAERRSALQMAFLLAWALACAALLVVTTFSSQLADLLFGWGRMSAANLLLIAQWSAAGAWSLLPQALIAVLLTMLAVSRQMQVAAWAYSAGLLLLGLSAWAGLTNGVQVMWALDAVLVGVAVVLLLNQRRSLAQALPWRAMLLPFLVTLMLMLAKPWALGLGLLPAAGLAALLAGLVLASAVAASAALRAFVARLLNR